MLLKKNIILAFTLWPVIASASINCVNDDYKKANINLLPNYELFLRLMFASEAPYTKVFINSKKILPNGKASPFIANIYMPIHWQNKINLESYNTAQSAYGAYLVQATNIRKFIEPKDSKEYVEKNVRPVGENKVFILIFDHKNPAYEEINNFLLRDFSLYATDTKQDRFSPDPKCKIIRLRKDYTVIRTLVRISENESAETTARCIATGIMANYGFSNISEIFHYDKLIHVGSADSHITSDNNKKLHSKSDNEHNALDLKAFIGASLLLYANYNDGPLFLGGEDICTARKKLFKREKYSCDEFEAILVKDKNLKIDKAFLKEIQNRCNSLKKAAFLG